jgi:hypothetical protein
LLDILERNALEEVKKRERGYPEDEERDIAHKIAVGAVRYFLMKFTRNSVIAFDFKEALSFQGETGPYIHHNSSPLLQRPGEAGEVGVAEPLLPGPVQHVDLSVGRDQLVRDLAGAVG